MKKTSTILTSSEDKLLRDYSIRTICIFLFGRLGDTAMRTPIVHQIRTYYPNAKITALVDSAGYELLQTNSEIDELIIMERNRKKKFSYILSRISTQIILWKRRFDLVINLYGGNSSHTMMRLSLAKYQVGYRHGKARCNISELSHLNGEEFLFERPLHLTNVLFRILVFFESHPEILDTTPLVFSSLSSDTKIKTYLDGFGFDNLYLISLAASDLHKILPIEKSYAQIEMLYHKYGYIPVIVCNPVQEFLQETLINNFLIPNNIPHIKLPLLSIDEISALMKQMLFTIVPDTGLYHISIGLERPTFAIFTHTNPILVEPSHGIYELCFQESTVYGSDGLKQGIKEIDTEYLLKRTYHFINRLVHS
jgi:ADP-heptose:LPS heptosyltransferase